GILNGTHLSDWDAVREAETAGCGASRVVTDNCGDGPLWIALTRLKCRHRTAALGAQRKHGTVPTDFRSPSENGPSRCGHLTARFAPNRIYTAAPRIGRVGWIADFANPVANG